jgi:DNA-binding SARP family transcriptional activator
LASIDQGHPIDCLVDLPHVTDTFLAGYEDIDPSFSDWLEVQRESVRQRLIRALEAQLLVGSRSAANTKSMARALFQIDPTHELACQKLMRAYVETGDIAGALVAYKRLWTNLEKDHDMEPSVTTQELVVAIKSGTYQPLFNSLAERDTIAIPTYRRGREYDIGATV